MLLIGLLVPTCLLLYLCYAAYREGGFGLLLGVECRSEAVECGEDAEAIRDRLERDGWVVTAGIVKRITGIRYVNVSRHRIAKYLPIRLLGIRPDPW